MEQNEEEVADLFKGILEPKNNSTPNQLELAILRGEGHLGDNMGSGQFNEQNFVNRDSIA